MTDRQQQIEFGSAEGAYSERENQLRGAILNSRVSVAGMAFVHRVFVVTNGGLRPYVASYEAMTNDAWCLPGKTVDAARKIVRETVKLGLIQREERRYVSSGQSPNAYTIDWESVKRIARSGASLRAATPSPDGTPKPSPDGPLPPGVYGQPPGHHGHPYKETTSSRKVSSSTLPSGPEAREGPGPDRSGEDRLFAELPELRSLRDRPVVPLPRGLKMRADPFAVLKDSDLANPARMALWFRHCADEFPPHQAEMALVLAAARRASDMSADELLTTRRRVFAGIVRRRSWHRVRRYLPDVLDWLNGPQAAETLTRQLQPRKV